MRAANWRSLQDKVIRPGIEEKFIPLMLYRGQANIGRTHRLWNFAIACMEHDVVSYTEAVKLSHNPDYAHLCGPERPIKSHLSLSSIFGRLIENPNVTNNIPGLLDYSHSIRGWKSHLTPFSLVVSNFELAHIERYAPWRMVRIPTTRPDGEFEIDGVLLEAKGGFIEVTVAEIIQHPDWKPLGLFPRRGRPRKLKEEKEEKSEPLLYYPYIVHDPLQMTEHEKLVMAVNAVVPSTLPEDLRADICQDIIVALLTGELTRERLADSARPFVKEAMKARPIKYGHLSLDAPVPGTEGMAWTDVI